LSPLQTLQANRLQGFSFKPSFI